MRWIADIVYFFAGLLYLPVLAYQALVQGKNRRGWGQRFGFVPFLPANTAVKPGRIWVHAVSLGEINATPKVIAEMESRWPGAEILISTTTDTGYARALQLYGRERVFRFPLDFSWVISRVLRRVKPSLIVLVELEVWFNLVTLASRRGIPVAVINGRLTERSATRLRLLGAAGRRMFNELAWVGAQDDSIAERFRACGVRSDRVTVTSSLKWDSASVAETVEGAEALSRAVGLSTTRPIWVCGSTGPGEEAILLDVYARLSRDLPCAARGVQSTSGEKDQVDVPILVLVPRKPERFDEVARLVEFKGFDLVRRSQCGDGSSRDLADECVVLGDTMGELRKFYALADVVFVGRSLVPMGGSDPMEAAALGKPLVVGPYTENFALPIAALKQRDAVRIVGCGTSLGDEIGSILQEDRESVREFGQRGRQVVVENQGATQRTIDGLAQLINSWG